MWGMMKEDSLLKLFEENPEAFDLVRNLSTIQRPEFDQDPEALEETQATTTPLRPQSDAPLPLTRAVKRRISPRPRTGCGRLAARNRLTRVGHSARFLCPDFGQGHRSLKTESEKKPRSTGPVGGNADNFRTIKKA